MTLEELDAYFHEILPIDEFAGIDSSRNGLQVSRQSRKVARVAFAVDAALQVFDEARAWGADLLFVHHGLFWGREEVLRGPHYQRIHTLIQNDLALYAVHLPLDAHLSLGNNARMAAVLGLVEVEPFGLVRNVPIGVSGRLAHPLSLEEVQERLFGPAFSPLAILPFGTPRVESVGIISGGAPLEVEQAISQGLDLYITGDANHVAYHRCRESGINAIFAGHYATETWGVRAVAEKLAVDTGIETTFLDLPTGL